MRQYDDKLGRVVDLLKRSEPVMPGEDGFTEEVISRIKTQKGKTNLAGIIYEFLFGWIYVGWVRRSFVAVSFCLILFFGFEQLILIKRVNDLSIRRYNVTGTVITGQGGDYQGRFIFYRLFKGKINEEKLEVTDEQIDRFIESVNDLKSEYGDLLELIENDPQLKKQIEDRLKKVEKEKSKL